MAIKVQFPAGALDITARGLFQWDYGQTLEIECAEIGSEILEVHFACPNMSEAIVRTCTFSNGVGTVTIPDECLEQTSAVTAWIYEVDSAQGHTIKTIVLPIAARTRPNRNRDIPANYVDAYGQLIEEVNEAINALENGNVTAAKAALATTAEHATTAGSAVSATYATSAGNASRLSNLYLHIYQISMDVYTPSDEEKLGTLYLKFNVTAPNELGKNILDGIVYTESSTPHYSEGFYVDKENNYYPILSYTCTQSDGTYWHYTIGLAHMSILGKSKAYTPLYTAHKIY